MSRPSKKIDSSIIEFLRSRHTFHNTPGIIISATKLYETFNCSQTTINLSVRRLLDSKIIIHKSGQLGRGSRNNPAHFALAEGFETGDGWKEKLGVNMQPNTVTATESRPKHVRGPKIPLGNVELAQKYSESLREIAPLKTANNELREQVLSLLNENKTLKDSNEKLQSEIEDLKTSEHLATVDLMKANAEIRTLTSTILAEDKRKEMLQRRINNFNR